MTSAQTSALQGLSAQVADALRTAQVVESCGSLLRSGGGYLLVEDENASVVFTSGQLRELRYSPGSRVTTGGDTWVRLAEDRQALRLVSAQGREVELPLALVESVSTRAQLLESDPPPALLAAARRAADKLGRPDDADWIQDYARSLARL